MYLYRARIGADLSAGHRRRFTLIELLVVVAIIAVLAAMLMPALSGARKRAKLLSCMSNQRQLAIGIMNYAEDMEAFSPLMDPHSGHTPNANVAGYYVASLDGGNGRHLYRGLGMIWAQSYTDHQVMECTDVTNDLAGNAIQYKNDVRWSRLMPKAANPLRSPGWADSSYVYHGWSVGSDGATAGAATSPARAGRMPRRIGRDAVKFVGGQTSRALVMCRQGGYNQPTLGAHDKRWLNVAFEDGHVVSVMTVNDFLNVRRTAAPQAWMGSWGNNESFWLGNARNNWWLWAGSFE